MASSTSLLENKVSVPQEFNRVSAYYDFATKMSQGYQEDLDTSAIRMDLKGDEKLLDLCCGTGKSTLACLKQLQSGTIVGVDNSEGMLLEADKKFSTQISSCKVVFVLSDAMQLNFPDNSFDAVFIAYGLRNMPDYEKALKGINRILKPGGKICIHDYCINDNIWAKAYWAILGYGFIVPFCTVLSGSSRIYTYLVKSVLTFLNPGQVKNLLEQTGFKNVEVNPLMGWRKPILHTFVAVKA